LEISNIISISDWLKAQDIVKTPGRVFGNEFFLKRKHKNIISSALNFELKKIRQLSETHIVENDTVKKADKKIYEASS